MLCYANFLDRTTYITTMAHKTILATLLLHAKASNASLKSSIIAQKQYTVNNKYYIFANPDELQIFFFLQLCISSTCVARTNRCISWPSLCHLSPSLCHLSPGSSMVRASHQRSEGCGFDSRLGLRNIFLSLR